LQSKSGKIPENYLDLTASREDTIFDEDETIMVQGKAGHLSKGIYEQGKIRKKFSGNGSGQSG
jgi:hypothetical protein